MILAATLAAALGVTTLEGQSIDPFDGSGAAAPLRALVFVFIHPDCPVSNRYVPELNRLHAEYGRRGVNMWVVYSGPEHLETVRAHYTAYGLVVPALVDSRFSLADQTSATTTGEAAVYGARSQRPSRSSWELVYRGRIDDRAPRVGIWRAVPAVRDLANVLQRLDRGEVLTYRTTKAVGCYLRPLS